MENKNTVLASSTATYTESHHSYIGDNPEWSLLDGSIHYSYPLFTFGGGHPLSCELIYDSGLTSITSEKFSGMPFCFKLSFHAQIIETTDGYIYIDEEGHPHLFKEIIDQGESYYKDTEGLGLLLDDHGLINITNGFGIDLCFDEQKRLIRKSISDSYEIEYEYNDKGLLTSVSDKTGGKRRFEFEYNGMLTCVKAYYGNELVSSVSLDYTTKHVFNLVVKWQLVRVDRISTKNSSESEPLLRISYKSQVFREEPPAIEFDDLYNHSAFRITYEDSNPTKLSFSDISKNTAFNEKSSLERSIDGNIVTIKDQDEQCTAYMLDQRGYIVSTFEIDQDGALRSLKKPKGNLLVLSGSNNGIDSLTFQTCNRGLPVTISECIMDGNSSHRSLSDLTTDKGTSLFVYVRLNESHPGALLSITGCIPATLNPYAVGVWQRVRLGFKDKLTSSKIEVSVCNDLGVAFSADICEPIVTQSATERIIMDGKGMNEFHQLTKGGKSIRGVVSKSDLLTSLKHFVFSSSITYFLWMNDGRDVIQMDDVCFTLNGVNLLFTDLFRTGMVLLAKYDTQRGLTTTKQLQRSETKHITMEKRVADLAGNTLEHEIRDRTVIDEFVYDSFGIVHRNHYTKDGLPLEHYSDEDKSVSVYEYDKDGNLTSIKTDSTSQSFTYGLGRLASITEGNVGKDISYDGFGRTDSILYSDITNHLSYDGGNLISQNDGMTFINMIPDYSNDFDDYLINGDLIERVEHGKRTEKTIYPNGSEITSTYDKKGNLLSVAASETDKATFTLSAENSMPIRIDDGFSGMTAEVEYRADNSIQKVTMMKDEKIYLSKEELHGAYDIEFQVGPGTVPYRKAISKQNSLFRIVYDSPVHRLDGLGSDTYMDDLGRPLQKKGSPINYGFSYLHNSSLLRGLSCDIFTENLEYVNNSFRVSKAVFSGNIQNNQEFQYDRSGRLLRATRTGDDQYYHSYTYQNGRLTEIRNYLALVRNNQGLITMVVDIYGKKENAIEYDCIGNITKYGEMALHYQYGHRLKKVSSNGTETVYDYTYDGTRISKTVNGAKTTFYYDGNTLLGEDRGDDVKIRYFRDTDSYTGFTLEEKGTNAFFVYVKDSFGNIIGIADSQGYLVGTYVYDEKGMLLKTVPNKNINGSEHILDVNPLRYRGYYYDKETGFYYLYSRYYNPVSMSFLTPDSKENIDGSSVAGIDPYCYCGYDPVNYSDPYGKFPVLVAMILIGAAVGALSYTASSLISYAFTGNWSWSWCQFTGSIIGGAVGGAFSAYAFPSFFISFMSSFVSTSSSMLLQDIFEGTDYSAKDMMLSSIASGCISALLSLIPDFKIKGLTAGRNSFKAITKSVTKKHSKNLIKNMTMKTIGKAFSYTLYTSTYGILFDGFFSISNDEEEFE